MEEKGKNQKCIQRQADTFIKIITIKVYWCIGSAALISMQKLNLFNCFLNDSCIYLLMLLFYYITFFSFHFKIVLPFKLIMIWNVDELICIFIDFFFIHKNSLWFTLIVERVYFFYRCYFFRCETNNRWKCVVQD